MAGYTYGVLMAGWLLWMAPFLLFKRRTPKAAEVDRRARWGILLVGLAFLIVWQTRFWEIPLATWRLGLVIILFALASILSWTAVRALGRHWRFDAGLNADHKLITSGPYRYVRHPIYTSILCLILAMGFMLAPVLLLLLAIILAIAGTEIRVRAEDNLLASRFGEKFRSYQRSVSAYVPLVR